MGAPVLFVQEEGSFHNEPLRDGVSTVLLDLRLKYPNLEWNVYGKTIPDILQGCHAAFKLSDAHSTISASAPRRSDISFWGTLVRMGPELSAIIEDSFLALRSLESAAQSSRYITIELHPNVTIPLLPDFGVVTKCIGTNPTKMNQVNEINNIIAVQADGRKLHVSDLSTVNHDHDQDIDYSLLIKGREVFGDVDVRLGVSAGCANGSMVVYDVDAADVDGQGVLGIGREMGGHKNVKNKDTYVSNKDDASSIVAKIHDIKSQMLEGKLVLVGDDVIPLKPLNVDGQAYAMDPFPCLSDTFASNEDTLSEKHQQEMKTHLMQSLSKQYQVDSSQRHRQGSRRLFEDILVSWDEYQLAFTSLSNLHISLLILSEGLYKFACKLDTLSSLLVQMNYTTYPTTFGNKYWNPVSPNRVDTIPNDNTNNTTTNNVAQNVVNEYLPQLLDSRRGSHVINVTNFDKEDFCIWKDRFLVYLYGLEPYFLEVLENGPFVPMSPLSTSTNPLTKPQKKWSLEDRKLVNQDKRLKTMWTDLVLAHKGPSDTRETKIAAFRLKFNAFKALEGEKRSNNSIKNDSLATLYGKYNYEEGMIDQIYESESTRFFIHASSSKTLISNTYLQDSDSDVEEDTRSSSEFLADLNAEFHDRALLANKKGFYKRSGRVGSKKRPMDKSNETCFACGKLDYKGKYKGLKAKIVILTKKIDVMSKGKNKKRLVAESFDWDEESVSFEDKGFTKVKTFMVIAEDEPSVEKVDARSYYTHVDLYYVEDQRKILLNKFNSLTQELSLYKSKLVDLKNTNAINCSLQNETARLNLENKSQRDEIFDLKKFIEKWTSSKVTLDQLLTEQVPGNIIWALGGRGKRKEQISTKEVVFTKADESPAKTAPEITSDSESECDVQEPLPYLPKLLGVDPIGTSSDVLSLVDLTQTPAVSKEIKQDADSSTEQLLLTLMEEVKGLEEQIKIHSDISPSVS
ncbi:hypothetical protein Tco_0352556 [Tanacetum coccineum]